MSISIFHTGDKYKYMYKFSIAYEEIYISMHPTGDRNKNKSGISVRFDV